MRVIRDRLGLDSANERGFSLIEVVVAIVILGMLTTLSLALYLASTHATTDQQRRDIGITIANETMESVVAWEPTGLLDGRAQTAVQSQWATGAGVSGLSETTPEWSASADASSTPIIPLSKTITRLGTLYDVETFIGSCNLPLSGGTCTKSVTGGAKLYRVIVVVTWTAGATCSDGSCGYEVSTLIEPTNSNLEWKTT